MGKNGTDKKSWLTTDKKGGNECRVNKPDLIISVKAASSKQWILIGYRTDTPMPTVRAFALSKKREDF